MWISQVKTALHGSKGHARAQKPRERKTVSAVLRFSLTSVWKACEWSLEQCGSYTYYCLTLYKQPVFWETGVKDTDIMHDCFHVLVWSFSLHQSKLHANSSGNINVFSVFQTETILFKIISYYHASTWFPVVFNWGWRTFCLACLQSQPYMVCFLQSSLWDIIH